MYSYELGCTVFLKTAAGHDWPTRDGRHRPPPPRPLGAFGAGQQFFRGLLSAGRGHLWCVSSGIVLVIEGGNPTSMQTDGGLQHDGWCVNAQICLPACPCPSLFAYVCARGCGRAGALCALATMGRGELQSMVLENPSFREFLELVPEVRGCVRCVWRGSQGRCSDN